MSPRAYSMEKRGAAAAETRRRILEAARRVLAEALDPALGMDSIARRAGLSRLTVYYHFRSRPALLEALYDYLAMRGNMHRRAAEALRERDPSAVLAGFVRALVDFWASDPGVIRRLHAMAALDAEIATGLQARETRRRRVAREILQRMAAGKKRTLGPRRHRLAADVVCALASFETYDALARARHGREEIIEMITRLARYAVAKGS
ncbi:MAG TPA: helix-turn-helix domain-containing protein [bacterium]|nr:helix-turn-helix domain-containing protein [bacterium]